MTAVMVFSHPNHEVALLGTIARLRPHLVFLTDGGGPVREEQSRRGLSDYVAPETVHFLGHSEQTLYDALLDGDTAFYGSLAGQVASILGPLAPEAVYCDMVEFYNPVHDMALPVVRAALGDRAAAVFEVPLIWQKDDGAFEMQRAPDGVPAAWNSLTAEETARKAATLRGGTYGMLFAQLGAEILAAIPTHAAREQVVPARTALPSPAAGQQVRYDARGRAALAAGRVARAIGYREHYVPLYRALCR